jgi:hypothetical protein
MRAQLPLSLLLIIMRVKGIILLQSPATGKGQQGQNPSNSAFSIMMRVKGIILLQSPATGKGQ